jgi:small subunit ribosomal protein S1
MDHEEKQETNGEELAEQAVENVQDAAEVSPPGDAESESEDGSVTETSGGSENESAGAEKKLDDIDFDKIEDMSAIYEMTIKNFEEGEVVKGVVVSIGADSVLVDIGFKSEGTIALGEFPDPGSIQVGDEVDVLIEVVEDQDGMIVLSKNKADKIKNWAKIQTLFEENKLVEGKIVRKVKGGFKVDIGLDAFLPASQIARRPVGDLDQYIGQTYDFRIIKLTKRRRNVVLSRKQVLEEARSEEKAHLLANLEIGQELNGVIKNITDFGAFIDVGGIDGLLHITDMSWGRIKHPSEVVSVGDKLTIKVLNFNKEEEKISLGLKQMTPNPWTNVEESYPIGAVARGKVVSMTDYGAFVQLEEGVEGMVHISEMSWTKRVRHPSEIVHIGQEIDVKLLNVDAKNEKISLGLKQIGENPWLKMKEKYPPLSIVTGIVRNLTDYGAFIQIEEGIDGLLHISDMSWTKKVNHPSEILKKGDEIEVQILNIDADSEKISLGIKQLEDDPWREVGERYRVGDFVETSISKLVSFGAFARLDNGIEGLIHISELSKDRVSKPEEVVKPGDTVVVKIISTDPATRKIGLSLKQYKEDLEKKDVDEYSSFGTAGGGVSLGEMAGEAMSAKVGEVVAGRLESKKEEAEAAVTEPEPPATETAEAAAAETAATEAETPEIPAPDAEEPEAAAAEAVAPEAQASEDEVTKAEEPESAPAEAAAPEAQASEDEVTKTEESESAPAEAAAPVEEPAAESEEQAQTEQAEDASSEPEEAIDSEPEKPEGI